MSGKRVQTFIRRIGAQLLDPGLCLGCAHPLTAQQHFCAVCAAALQPVENPCRLCAQPVGVEHPVCAACLYHPPRWQKMIAPLKYQGLSRDLLIQLKFGDQLHLANSLLSDNIDAFRTSHPKPEALLPVPLHRHRILGRGYNQALEIAIALSRSLDIAIDSEVLRRVRNTQIQSGLSAHKRDRNMRQAFTYDSNMRYAHVAIVDDIITTGSTVNEICKILHTAGVKTVEVWGLARVLKTD